MFNPDMHRLSKNIPRKVFAAQTGSKVAGSRLTSTQAFRRLALILFIFACLALAHSFWLPLHEAPDEVAHFLYTRFIATTGRLPLDDEERELAGYKSYRPPLYHIFSATLIEWANGENFPRLKFVWESPRFEMANALLNTKRLANTEDELPPFDGDILMWHLGRLVSIVLSMGTITVAFFTILELFPENYWLALVSASIPAFVPTFIFISSSMSTDALTGLILGFYVWMLVKLVKSDNIQKSVPWKNYILLGLLIGASTTTNYATVLLPLQVVGVVTFLVWRHRWGRTDWLRRVAATGIAAIIAAGWWFIYLIVYFNEIDQYGLVIGSLKPIIAGGIDASQRYVAFLLTGGAIGIQDSPEFIS
ncbi:MAG: glycosyltransferase family 39 protein, partial [Chloroflexota bacterium]